MRTLWISLLAVSVLVAFAPAGVAKVTNVKMPYDGPAVTSHTTLAQDCSGQVPQTIGVVCLAIPKGATRMTFSVDDKTDFAIGGTYYVYDALGSFYSLGHHCGETTVDVPGGGTAIVRLDVIDGPLYCVDIGETPGEGTKGFVAFTLR